MTAAIVATPRNNSSFLIPSFEALFRASLTARQQTLQSDESMEEDKDEEERQYKRPSIYHC